jgi:hypothetical protein
MLFVVGIYTTQLSESLSLYLAEERDPTVLSSLLSSMSPLRRWDARWLGVVEIAGVQWWCLPRSNEHRARASLSICDAVMAGSGSESLPNGAAAGRS